MSSRKKNILIVSKPQIKQHVYLQSTTIDVSGTFWDLTAIPQGTTFAQRVGAQATIAQLSHKVRMVCADTTNVMRLIIFKWHPSDTSDAPQISELFVDAANPLLSPVLHYRPSRFSILLDKLYSLTLVGANQCVTDEWRTGRLGLVQYDIGVNTGSKHIYAYCVSDSSAASHPSLLLYSSVLFYD